MDSSELKNLLDRYLKNDVSEHERKLVDEWYQSYNGDEYFLSTKKESQLRKEIYGFVKEKEEAAVTGFRWLTFMRYAAAITALLITAALLSRKIGGGHTVSQTFTTIKTGTGQVRKLQLPDGSMVWLNAKTIIRINENGDKANRKVYLDEGEAFFEVTKNPALPFLVITNNITTRVLGTSFNVAAYKQLNNSSVTVKTGRVQVSNKQKQLAVLHPNQKITYFLKEDSSKVTICDAGRSNTWASGQTILNYVSFNELALLVRNIYGIKLSSKNKLTYKYKYNITISSSHTADETLKVICSVHHNSYRRKNNEVIIY